MNKLPLVFYERQNVVQIAMELIGKIIVTNINRQVVSARIVETEAYVAFTDKASHAYNGRRTPRNEPMYCSAGTVYVYICYGMHCMLNIVTNKIDVPDAVLIRAVEPIKGINYMVQRSGKTVTDNSLSKGPGNVAKVLGVQKQHSGLYVMDDTISIYEDGCQIERGLIGCSKRIGIDSAGEDAHLPYRYYLRGNKYVSGKPVK